MGKLEEIILEELEVLGDLWTRDTMNWYKVFQRSLKKYFFFQDADEKWTYFVFYQPHKVWPQESLSAKQVYALRFAKLVSHLNPHEYYVDRKYGVDPMAPDGILSPQETAKGLKLWADSFSKNILPKMIRSYEKVLDKGAARILEACPEIYGKPCKDLESAKRIFHNVATEELAPKRQIWFKGHANFITNPLVELLWHFYRV